MDIASKPLDYFEKEYKLDRDLLFKNLNKGMNFREALRASSKYGSYDPHKKYYKFKNGTEMSLDEMYEKNAPYIDHLSMFRGDKENMKQRFRNYLKEFGVDDTYNLVYVKYPYKGIEETLYYHCKHHSLDPRKAMSIFREYRDVNKVLKLI